MSTKYNTTILNYVIEHYYNKSQYYEQSHISHTSALLYHMYVIVYYPPFTSVDDKCAAKHNVRLF